MAFDGTHFRIAEFHQMQFDCFLATEVALAHATGGTVMVGETNLAPDRNSVQSLVAVRQDGGWHLASLHDSRAEFVGRPEAAAALTAELRQLL